MKLAEFKKIVPRPLRQATLVFLVKDKKVLLAMKKRGFGVGRWNGVGGKLMHGETIKQAAIRESEEEVGVKITCMERVAKLNFYFPAVPTDKNFDQQVIVYLARSWTGKPVESEEMKPKWFPQDKLPYADMWPDDPIWLPLVLEGKKVSAEFMFGENDTVDELKVSAR